LFIINKLQIWAAPLFEYYAHPEYGKDREVASLDARELYYAA